MERIALRLHGIVYVFIAFYLTRVAPSVFNELMPLGALDTWDLTRDLGSTVRGLNVARGLKGARGLNVARDPKANTVSKCNLRP